MVRHGKLFPKQATGFILNGFTIDFHSIYFGFHICRPFNEDFSGGIQVGFPLPMTNDILLSNAMCILPTFVFRA